MCIWNEKFNKNKNMKKFYVYFYFSSSIYIYKNPLDILGINMEVLEEGIKIKQLIRLKKENKLILEYKSTEKDGKRYPFWKERGEAHLDEIYNKEDEKFSFLFNKEDKKYEKTDDKNKIKEDNEEK